MYLDIVVEFCGGGGFLCASKGHCWVVGDHFGEDVEDGLGSC
jgi:hypothetical protein